MSLRYNHTTRVQAPLNKLAEFHYDARALKRLTPPPLIMQIHEAQPLAEGSLMDFTMWMGPVPIHWRAVHSQVDRSHGFTDMQESGPFKKWIHQHTFREIDAQTSEVVDEIQAEFGVGLVKGILSRLMWLGLQVLFAYRGWATRRAVEG